MTRVRLPDGCTGLDMANGKKYTAEKPGGTVEVSGKDAHYIDTSFYGQKQAGIMRGGPQFTIGTKTGRWCLPCKRLWQGWSVVCPRCGTETAADRPRD
jgi:hypothetical protein